MTPSSVRGSGSNDYSARRGSMHDSSGGRGGDHVYPFASLVPTQARLPSRSHSMTVQHVLNPSDEEPRFSAHSRSSQSSDTDSDRLTSSPCQADNFFRSGPQYRRGNTSRGSGRAQVRASRQAARQSRSMSTSGSEASEPRRHEGRKKYTDEEAHFIWYLRIDRGYLWPDIKDAFNARFAHQPGDARDVSGLQCRYYRLFTENHVPQVRTMTRTADSVQRYGMRAVLARAGTQVDYAWLDGEYPANGYGQVLRESKRPTERDA